MTARRARDERPVSGMPVEVAAAVVERADGSFLLAQRPAGKVYAGYWEFPGGKIETGETPLLALKRELHEELGIETQAAFPWISRVYAYPHATVRLNFMRVTRWQGEPTGRELQAFSWQRPEALTVGPMLPANAPILKALRLPLVYAITNAAEFGTERLLQKLEAALANGLRLVQIREKQMAPRDLGRFAAAVVEHVRAAGGRTLVNGTDELARRIGADGVHLTAAQLMAASSRPQFEWCAASCHSALELEAALRLGVDFVVLGPVQPTPSHPAAQLLGWERFATLVHGFPLPAYALGGLRLRDLDRARSGGAHGIAMMRGAWLQPDSDAPLC
ncbi:MAG: Nudix family hydrolase [Burkholderiales bacterium]